MNKQGLIEKVAEIKGVSLKEAETSVKAVFTAIAEGIKTDGEADIYGFAKFEIAPVAARRCKNPKTGEYMTVPAGKKVRVSLKKAIKDLAL